MAIVIDGSSAAGTLNLGTNGTISNLAVGGLPDGIVDTDMLATDAATAAKIGAKVPVSYALVVDRKDQNTAGGSFTSGGWRTRDLNTIVINEDTIVTATSGNDSFSLNAGTYRIRWAAPAYEVSKHMSELYDATASSDIAYGNAAYNQIGYSTGHSIGSHVVTITSANDYKIRHRCSSTRNTDGFGMQANFNWEYYTIVEIWRYA